MRTLPILVGGLVTTMAETCFDHDGSFFHEAAKMAGGRPLTALRVDCGREVTGLLPLLAQASVPHAGVVHEVGSGVEWARRVSGPAWTLPCLLAGLRADRCTGPASAVPLVDRVRVWCFANRFIADTAAGADARAGAGAAAAAGPTYERRAPDPKSLAADAHVRSGLPDDVRSCLAEFNPTAAAAAGGGT